MGGLERGERNLTLISLERPAARIGLDPLDVLRPWPTRRFEQVFEIVLPVVDGRDTGHVGAHTARRTDGDDAVERVAAQAERQASTKRPGPPGGAKGDAELNATLTGR